MYTLLPLSLSPSLSLLLSLSLSLSPSLSLSLLPSLRSTLPKSDHSPPIAGDQAAVEGGSGAVSCSLQVWTSVTSALCTANNNPQNGMFACVSVNRMNFCLELWRELQVFIYGVKRGVLPPPLKIVPLDHQPK